MSTLFPRRTFTGFGPTQLAPTLASTDQVRSGRPSLLRKRMLSACPRCPGVYGMLDRHGCLIYVGKAKQLRTRLACYFRPRSRDAKAGRILQHTRTILWESAPSEFAALLRELELIRRWQPRFNVHGQPHRRQRTYVCIGRRPAPYVFLSRRAPTTASAVFGPVPAGYRSREAMRRLNDWFQLRDCPQSQSMLFADQVELFPILRAAGCIRHEIGTCLGPCAAACTSSAYRARVRAVRAFLSGRDDAPLDQLKQNMTRASAELAFERAADLRDKLDVLRWLRDTLSRLEQARTQYSCIYPLTGLDETTLWYLIHRGRIAAVIPVPRTARQKRDAGELIDTVYGQRRSRAAWLQASDVETVFLIAAWFRRYPQEQARTLPPAQALDLLQQ